MKLKFKTQAYQTAAVQSVVDCFIGQRPRHGGIRYRLDLGNRKAAPASLQGALALETSSPETAAEQEAAFRNADFTLSEATLLDNIRTVQQVTPSESRCAVRRHVALPVMDRRLADTTAAGTAGRLARDALDRRTDQLTSATLAPLAVAEFE